MGKESFSHISLPQIFVECELCGFYTFQHSVGNVKISLPIRVRHEKCVIIQLEFMGKESFSHIPYLK